MSLPTTKLQSVYRVGGYGGGSYLLIQDDDLQAPLSSRKLKSGLTLSLAEAYVRRIERVAEKARLVEILMQGGVP